MFRCVAYSILAGCAVLGVVADLSWAEGEGDPHPTSQAAATLPSAAATSFPLKEISLEDAIQAERGLSFYSQRVYLGDQESGSTLDASKPRKEVQKYPPLKSDKPLYGVVRFGKNYNDPTEGKDYQFVIDATKGEEYDTLYFDANGDLDLTNDPIIGLNSDGGPKGLWPWEGPKEKRILFNELSVPMDYSPDVKTQPVRILPLLVVQEKYSVLMFFPHTCRSGSITIGGYDYDVILSQSNVITGRYDRPWTRINFKPIKANHLFLVQVNGADELRGCHLVNDVYYSLSTTPAGDTLFVHPYTGDQGIFKIGPGNRNLTNMTVQGSLLSPQKTVTIGKRNENGGGVTPVSEWSVPVGDYAVNYITVNYGTLRISLSRNSHSEGKPQDADRQRKFNIAIRKDQPFVLDFSHTPELMFTSPAAGVVVHPGEYISVNTALVDPELDVLMCLEDAQEKKTIEITLPDGKTHSFEKQKPLEPTVTITNAAGEKVAEGVMPFG